VTSGHPQVEVRGETKILNGIPALQPTPYRIEQTGNRVVESGLHGTTFPSAPSGAARQLRRISNFHNWRDGGELQH